MSLARNAAGQAKRVVKGALGAGERKREAAQASARLAARVANMAQLPPVRVAVAGAGKYAQQHLEVLAAMGNVRLCGISNRGGSDISAMGAKFGAEATYGDYRRMLDAGRPDAVFIVVSHFETVNVAADCLERGLPCLIEKPAGFTAEETERLAEIAARRGVMNMVGVNRRYLSTVQYGLGAVLARGPLMGIHIDAPEAIQRIRANTNLDERLYEQWLVGNSIHAIDLFRCLGGEAVDFDGRRDCRVEKNGDSFAALMRLSSGGIGTYVAHWLSAPGWSMSLYGQGIRVNLNMDRVGSMVFANGKSAPIKTDPIDNKFKPGLFAQNEAFVTALALGERPGYPASDLADSAKTMRLIEAIATA